MSKLPSTRQVYQKIKKNRKQKKRMLYRLAFGVAFDRTILVYLTFFLVFGLFWVHDILKQTEPIFLVAENIATDYFFLILIVAAMRSLSFSFTRPGVRFSSAELLLSMLPYDKKKLWYFNAFEKNTRFSQVIVAMAVLVYLVTPFTFLFVFSVTLSLILIECLMTIPQWVIYQLPWYIKLIITQAPFVIGLWAFGLSFFVANPIYLTMSIFLFLVIVNFLLFKRVFQRVRWHDVVKTNDQLIWNIFFISKMSKIEIKPPKRQGVYHHMIRNKRLKRPFSWTKPQSIYHRNIFLLFTEQKEQMLQGFFGVIFILIALSFHHPYLLGVGIALGTILYVQIAVSFFVELFKDKLIFSLPWRIDRWEKYFARWVFVGSIPLFVVLIGVLFLFTDQWIWIPFLLLSYIIVGKYFVQFVLESRVILITKQSKPISQVFSVIVVILFLYLMNSTTKPAFSILVILCEIIRYTYVNRTLLIKGEQHNG